MRRRRGRRRGGRRKGALPVVQTAMIAYPVIGAVRRAGFTEALPVAVVADLTGFDITQNKLINYNGVKLGVALLLTSTLGKKIANRTGVNRMFKKLSGNLIQLM